MIAKLPTTTTTTTTSTTTFSTSLTVCTHIVEFSTMSIINPK